MLKHWAIVENPYGILNVNDLKIIVCPRDVLTAVITFENMSHSFNSQLMHCVFSTKERRNLITPELSARLYPYIGGIAREHKIKLLKIGGVSDHVHLLISLPSTVSISKAMQLIKGGSSKWVHDSFPEHRLFEWQQGYGAFSIGIGDVERTTDYIENQAEHHQKTNFKTEFLAFLKRHGIEYDECYIFD